MKIKNIKILVCLFVSLCTSMFVKAQDAFVELGVNVGASFYLGDLNPSVPFHNSHPAFGLNGAYNINSRVSIRAAATFGTVSGTKDKYSDRLPIADYSFSSPYSNFDLRLEFNFFSYTFNPTQPGEKFITPFVFTGIGYTPFGEPKKHTIGIPVGLGVKYKIAQTINLGAQWKFESMNRDDLDNLSDPYHVGETGVINNDWISTFSFFVSFDLFPNEFKCVIKDH